MANLKYRDLLEHLLKISDERLGDNVTIYLSESDEYFAASGVVENNDADVLDEGHSYITVTI